MDLYDSAPVGFLTLNAAGKMLQLNIAAAGLLGCERRKAIGARLVQFIELTEQRAFADFIEHARGSPTRRSHVATLADKKRTTVHFEMRRHEDSATHHVAMLDISERVRAEAEHEHLSAQLRESQKMEALGTLAGGIAHDFNNILAAILGNAALGQESVESNHPVPRSKRRESNHPARTCFAEIEKASSRAKRLVEQILAFSRHRPTTFNVQPLAPIVYEVARLIRVGLPTNISLNIRVPDEPMYVRADDMQIQQVLLNLLANAVDATRDSGGCITLAIEPCKHVTWRRNDCGRSLLETTHASRSRIAGTA